MIPLRSPFLNEKNDFTNWGTLKECFDTYPVLLGTFNKKASGY